MGAAGMRGERQLLFWLAALALFVAAIALLKNILLPFAVAVVLAYFLNPVADRLVERGIGRTWAATLIVGLVALLVALVIVLLVPVVVDQTRRLVAALPGELDRLQG